MSLKPHLEIGYIRAAHGLAGEVAVKTFDPGSETLFELDRILLRARDGAELELQLDSVRATNKEILIGLEGVEDRTRAEALVGSTVLAFREDLPPPEEGEFFTGDLVGLSAVDPSGAPLGTVEEIWDTGPVPNLVIRAKDKPELILPFADDFIGDVNLEEKRVVVYPERMRTDE